MNILIVEDEKLSAQKLQGMLQKLIPDAQIVKITDSVGATLDFLKTDPSIDIGFFDIQLADGISFEIFENFRVSFPVIFTTAFNEYAIQAFKVNSIDYLLKPIDEKALRYALEQFHASRPNTPAVLPDEIVAKALNMLTRKHKNRFLVKVGEHLRVIQSEEIAMFYSMEKAIYLKTLEDRNYPVDFTLDQLVDLLDPESFFRVNRKHIVSMAAITDIIAYSGSRLKIKLKVTSDEDIITSRDRVAEFKGWLGR
ncbi:MAG: DNA-binding response regulator [Bacteroidetes bacterium]|nr:MAG: DNA-binding response regulator [Bacteroidota bacterium]